MMHRLPLPITAYGVCNALGASRQQVLSALMEARSGLAPVTQSEALELPFTTLVGPITESLPSLPAELSAYSTRAAGVAQLLLDQMQAELVRARERWSPERIGLFLGTSTAGADVTEAAYRHYVAAGKLPPNYDFERQHAYGAILDLVKQLAGISGPSWMVSTTCTSSGKPFATAQRLIETDVIDAAIVGGIDTLCAMTLTGFGSLGALSAAQCKPFSSERDGINIGEAGAFLLLERSGDARALLEGVGESSDAYHISAPHPEGEGAELAMRGALAQAGVEPNQVDHVNAHGTGTPHNDIAEGKAISRVFGPHVPVASTKGYTGHTLGAASATEALFSVLSLEEGLIPKSLGATPLDPRLEISVAHETLRQPVRRVVSNSLAFGGNNVSLVLRSV